MFSKSFFSTALLITFGLVNQSQQSFAAEEPTRQLPHQPQVRTCYQKIVYSAQCDPTRLQSFGQGIISVAFSPNGSQVLATIFQDLKSKGCCARICRSSDGKKEVEFDGRRESEAAGGVFSPDARRVAVGFISGRILLFDASNAKVLLDLPTGHRVTSPVFNPQDPNLLLVAQQRGTTQVINSHTGGKVLLDFQRPAYAASYSSDGKCVAIGGEGIVHLCDTKTGNSFANFKCYQVNPTSVSFSRDGKFLAAGDYNGRVYIFDTAAGEILNIWQATNRCELRSVAFSPCSHYLVTGSEDAEARVWNPDNGQMLLSLVSGENLEQAVESAAFSPNAHHIATGSKDGKALIWDVSAEKCGR